MDIYCHLCLEPIDIAEFHDIAEIRGMTYREVARDFRKRGCDALGDFGGHNTATLGLPETRARGMVIAELGDLLGDDIDGFASLSEDYKLGEFDGGYGTP